jgi:ABC-type nitrate/sulfonate/bicarbonate transport system substrate-binding protein
MYHDTAYTGFAANAVEFTLYSSPRLEKGYVGQGLYALEKTLKDRPKVIEAFLRGLTMSLVYSTNDPAGATKAFGEMQPEVAKNPKLEEVLWRERMKISEPPPHANGEWGYMDAASWDNFLEVLMLGKLITKKPPLETLYTTQFLKEANAIDKSKLPK